MSSFVAITPNRGRHAPALCCRIAAASGGVVLNRDVVEHIDSKIRDVRLDSWKEIAAYLKRDIRTVQRCEKLEALPIHRHQHLKRGSPFAYAAELDAWWEGPGRSLDPVDIAAPAPGLPDLSSTQPVLPAEA